MANTKKTKTEHELDTPKSYQELTEWCRIQCQTDPELARSREREQYGLSEEDYLLYEKIRQPPKTYKELMAWCRIHANPELYQAHVRAELARYRGQPELEEDDDDDYEDILNIDQNFFYAWMR